MNNINVFFENKFQKSDEGIYILDKKDHYVKNFGKQWKNYNKVQIDSYNNFLVSKNFLKKIIFNELNFLKGKKNIRNRLWCRKIYRIFSANK